MGETIYITSSGLNSMVGLSEEQEKLVKSWVNKAEQTVSNTELTDDARVSINQSIPKIEPILEDFMRAINTTINNYDEANKGLVTTTGNIEAETRYR